MSTDPSLNQADMQHEQQNNDATYYYIHDDQEIYGPYDLLDMIRKIRNNAISRNDLLSCGEGEQPAPAYKHPELYGVFLEQEAENLRHIEAQQDKFSIGDALREGLSLLRYENTPLALCTSIILLMIAVAVASMTILLPTSVAALVAPPLAYLIFAAGLLPLLRISRVQLLNAEALGAHYRRHVLKIVLMSIPPALLGISIPWLLTQYIGYAGWALAVFPGAFIIAYFFFIPLIMVEYDVGIGEALRLNQQAVRNHGVGLIGLVAGLLCLNLPAAILLLPLLISLPITLGGLMRCFDEYFFD